MEEFLQFDQTYSDCWLIISLLLLCKQLAVNKLEIDILLNLKAQLSTHLSRSLKYVAIFSNSSTEYSEAG